MIDFAPGMRTIIRDEEWMVKKIETNSLGNKTLYCVGISPLVKDREAIFLTDLEEIQIVDPAEVKLVADTSPFYKRALLYLESQWRQQIPTDANLHIGHKAAMDLMPYQLDPAKLALQRPRQRILIADTVGLGKTLEAGILMSELIARGKGKRILVVTVKSMMTQFQKEMWNRFTIPLVRLDSNRIQKIRANLPSNYNPFFYYDKTIVSIDTLKRDVEYRTHLENAYWDIIVIDEAQNVAERGDHQAQRSRLAKLLADRSDTMIMLSATPHDGRAKSFASLMNMLDPTAIADPQNYTPEDIKGLCIRRFKKDVKDQVSGSFLERKITLERCNASAKEEYAFDIFAEMQLEMDLGKTKGTGQLFKTSLEKSLFSSPAACIKSIEARLKKLYKKYTADDIKDIHLLENLKTALEAITPADFTRYQKLLDLIRSKEYAWNPADSGDRVVIFTERIETMKYLAERLRKDLGLKANAIQEISGGMSDAEQQRIVEDFGRTESPVRVLVASDVASEGLNLHYLSHRLIHFDIPWSLMVFQQRNGRIDRYGQQNRPDIRYMLIESDNKRIKGDMRIIEILITKEEQALKNIGDPSLLLGKFTIEDEELVVAETIESGSDSDAFEQTLDAGEDDFDPFEALMAAAGKEEDEDEKKSEIVSDETLFSDMDYLYQALTYLNQTENHSVERLKTVSGLDIRLTPDMERRLKALVPEEALPQGETLRVSDDKAFCMEQMRRKMPALMQANAYEECLFLYREFSTEILRLLVPATTMDSSSVKMESFVAAFMLGMKEYFGNVDHLRATVSEVPVPDADYRKQYLVIYDSVPGGTGYLKQLMHEKNALIEIFERALHVMENCSCKDDPQKDGCYHCLYAYRQSQQIGNISRTTAIRILKSILSGKDNVQKIDKINDIPVNPLFDSELEQRFMEAIRTKVGAANVSDTIRNGKHSYYVKIENFAWEIEPQVPLDAGSGVSVDCKPDFVFWPVSAPEHKPVAVFTDGFLYHKDIVSDDTIKREAIRRSGNFRVWSLSFKDVQSVFAPQGDFYTTTLEAEKMPSGKTMYQNMIKKQKADVIEPARLSSFDLLLEYLKLPDAERVFKGQAYAYSLSLLEPALMKNNLAFNNWEMIVKAVNDQTHFTNADFVFLGTIFGSWIPRTSNAHLAIHSAILASELKAGGAVAVCAVLNDEKDRRTDKYEQEWNGLWRFYNVMQFSDEFIAVSSVGMSHMDYLALPVAINADSDTVAPVAAVDDAWNAIKELLFDDDAKAFVEIAKDAGVPAPDEDNIGYEVEGGDGEVVAAVEIAWPDRRIGFMTAEQAEDKEKLEKLGWRILNLLDAANMDVASYFGGDNQ